MLDEIVGVIFLALSVVVYRRSTVARTSEVPEIDDLSAAISSILAVCLILLGLIAIIGKPFAG